MTVAKQERGVTGLPGAPGLDSALPTQGAGIKIPHNSAKERGEREMSGVAGRGKLVSLEGLHSLESLL